jgi:hypothetical protein
MKRLTSMILALVILVACQMCLLSPLTAQPLEWSSPLSHSSLLPPPMAMSDLGDFRVKSMSDNSSASTRKSFSMGSLHKYLGYGTLVLAAGAAFSSSSKDVHEPLGYAAASAATLTCITGFMEYSDYFNLDEGWSKYNIHIAAGVAATAGFIVTAILGADGNDHGGIGGGSTVLMCVPIVILKW